MKNSIKLFVIFTSLVNINGAFAGDSQSKMSELLNKYVSKEQLDSIKKESKKFYREMQQLEARINEEYHKIFIQMKHREKESEHQKNLDNFRKFMDPFDID